MTLLIDPPQTVQPSEPRHLPRERRLIDSFGRRISDMRISVTDRCNFRCVYCMPEEGMQWLKRDILLTFDEIERLTRIAVELGIEEVRLTGGEPTLRPDLPRLVERLSQIDVRSLSTSICDRRSTRRGRPAASRRCFPICRAYSRDRRTSTSRRSADLRWAGYRGGAADRVAA